jgi:UDP-N-acetylglucosamine--dolichyl-phosphate N-acetylglucosaminephosphotransferase
MPTASTASVRLESCTRSIALILHRLDSKTGRLQPSTATFTRPPSPPTTLILQLLAHARLVRLTWSHDGRTITSTTNLTLISALLVLCGPMREPTLCKAIMGLQVAGSALAFAIRYGAAGYFYGPDRR